MDKFKQIDNLIYEALGLTEGKAGAMATVKHEPLPYPQLRISDNWGQTGGTPELVSKVFQQIQGSDIQGKIDSLNNFIFSCSEKGACPKMSIALSNILVLDAISSILHEYEAQGAGQLFENFMAMLVLGTKEGGNGGITDFWMDEPGKGSTSLKLLKKGGRVEGSVEYLNRVLNSPELGNKCTYIVAYKGESLNKLAFYKAEVTSINDVDISAANPNRFTVPTKSLKKIASLGGLSPKVLRKSAANVLKTIDSSISEVYENLSILSNSLTLYFLEDEVSEGHKAKQSSNRVKEIIYNKI